MSFLKSLSRLLSKGGRAAALHERGMAKAKCDDWAGAIVDYTAAIDCLNVPDALVATARFNRALAYAHQELYDKAEEDLQAVVATLGAPEKIRAAAKEKLVRWEKRRAKNSG